MRGGLTSVAVKGVGLSTAMASPSDAHLRIVPQHEPVRARLDRLAVDAHVSPDEAVDDAVGEVADAGTLEHDAVLDLRFLNDDVIADRRERTDVRVHDAGAAPDDRRTANHRSLDDRARLDDDFAFNAAVGIHRAVDPALEGFKDQTVGFEHVLELAGVFPPSLDDVRSYGETAVDQVLDGVGDLELVTETRLDAVHRFEDVGTEHIHADEREVADRLLRLFDEAHDLAVLELRDAEHLRIGHARQDNLRGGVLCLAFAGKLRDALVQQIVAEVHHARIRGDV